MPRHHSWRLILISPVFSTDGFTNLSNWFEDTSAQQSAGVPANGVETVAVTLNSSLLLEERLFITVSTENPGP